MHVSYIACSGALVLGAGCLAGPSPDDAGESEVSSEVLASNGMSVNGVSLNGISVNGVSLNGMSVNGVSLNGMSVNGISLNGMSVNGSQLQGVKASGGTISGAALIGAVMAGQLSNGASIDLRIDNTALLPAPNADIRTYSVSYTTSSGWKPLCVGATGANEAIAFPGTWAKDTIRHQWDSNMFTLACRGATFAKCAELGYKGDALLDTYHATCIRAIRADYCGDGQSHTITGTQINIYDKLGLQTDTQTWSFESNWTPDGATCINQARVLTSLEVPNVPWCIADRAHVVCATSAWPSAVLLRTEVNK